MSWRRGLSFSDNEKDLKDDFDNLGKSDYVKRAMRFLKQFENRVFIVPEGMSFNTSSLIPQKPKRNVKKFIK